MKMQKLLTAWMGVFASVLFLHPFSSKAEIVYDNSSGTYLAWMQSTNELGDEITLGGSSQNRFLSQIKLQYFLQVPTNGLEVAHVNIYETTTNHTPGPLLYDSGPNPIHSGYGYITVNPNIVAPDTFIFTVEFKDIMPGAKVGLMGYNAPTIGASTAYFVEKINGVWYSRNYLNFNPPGDAYAVITAQSTPANLAPILTLQPTNITVKEGKTAVFSVSATGTPPLSYQWKFNGTNLLEQTNAVCTLINVLPEQAGNYSVRVSNPVGSASSSNAVLSVTALIHGSPVYDNTTNYLGLTFASTNEYGDQVTLAGNPDQRKITQFTFEYYNKTQVTGNEKIRVRFYNNAGVTNSPYKLLYESQEIPIINSNGGFNLISLTPNVVVPETFTWTVQFFKPGIQFHQYYKVRNGVV